MGSRRLVAVATWSFMGLMRVPGEPGAALGGEAVFLEAAVGFAGEGALDEAGSEHLTNALVELARGGLLADRVCDF